MRDPEFENIEGADTKIKSKEDKLIEEQIEAIISSNETTEVLLNSSEQEVDEESSELASEAQRAQPDLPEIDIDFDRIKNSLKGFIDPTVTLLTKVGSKIAESNLPKRNQEEATNSQAQISNKTRKRRSQNTRRKQKKSVSRPETL